MNRKLRAITKKKVHICLVRCWSFISEVLWKQSHSFLSFLTNRNELSNMKPLATISPIKNKNNKYKTEENR